MTGTFRVGNRVPALGPVPIDMYLTHLADLLVRHDADSYANLRIELSDTYYADGRRVQGSSLIAAAQGTLATVTVSGDGMLDEIEPGDALPYRVVRLLMQALNETKADYYTEDRG